MLCQRCGPNTFVIKFASKKTKNINKNTPVCIPVWQVTEPNFKNILTNDH
jgi:hypothetical protein